MAMVISPKGKIVTLALLIGIILLVALLVVGVMSLVNSKGSSQAHALPQPPQHVDNNPDTKMLSSRLQQFTTYALPKQVSPLLVSTTLINTHIHTRAYTYIHNLYVQ